MDSWIRELENKILGIGSEMNFIDVNWSKIEIYPE
jgi:hypothetical protein